MVGDLDILVPIIGDFGLPDAVKIASDWFGYEEIRGGAYKSEGLVPAYKGLPLLLNFWSVPSKPAMGAMLLFATGPYDLNIMMRAKAQGKGWKLSQYGLFATHDELQDETQLDDGTEEGIFSLLQLQYLNPVERETWRDHLIPIRKDKAVVVPSSNGVDVYHVRMVDGKAVECECKGFTYRKKCRHLAEAEAKAKKSNP
jgi:DNA polymerase/3'-5' exonuclease PolX